MGLRELGGSMSAVRSRRRSSAKASATTRRPAQAAAIARASGPRARLRELYFGHTKRAVRFRYGLLAFDLTTIAFVVGSSFFHGDPMIEAVGIGFGLILLLDLVGRMWACEPPLRDLLHPLTIADLIAVVSFLAPLAGANLAFLRALRALRLFRSYQLVSRLRRDFPFFRRNQEVVFSAVNVLVFTLIMTALVFETQIGRNPDITNYADALYFTVTTLTTTGFGDITLEGTGGRLLAVLIMIFGVSLFIRLAQAVFRPSKVQYRCPKCGLSRHEADAVNCKDCGEVLNIPNEE
jgi:voltage-gated potassium channel